MDTTKQNPLAQAQESDDLIAELARLVAQDARSQSVNSAAYSNAEPVPQAYDPPRSQPEPQLAEEPEVVEPYASAPAHQPDPFDTFETPRHTEPAFDFGVSNEPTFALEEQAPQQPAEAYDPIADLIASAEVDAFAADEEPQAEPEDDLFAVKPDLADFPAIEPVEPRAETYREPTFSAEPAYAAFDEPEAQQSPDERDPLSEIEALIGEAARVTATSGADNSGRKVRSAFLDTADYQDLKADQAVDAAESAILAAAAASGGQVARVQPVADVRSEPEIPDTPAAPVEAHEPAEEAFESEDYAAAEEDERPYRKPRRGGYVLPAVAGTAIVALLAGGYFLFLAPEPVPSEAPVLTADAGGIKEIPEVTPAETAASQSVIFNEIDGNTVPPENEALVSRDQTNGATGAAVGSVLAPEEGEIGLANRPVRTVTVRPDGTIVSSDNSVAGSNVLPVERPDVPAVPNSSLTSDPIGEAIAAAIANEPVAPTTAAPAAAPAVETVAAAPEAAPAPQVETPAATPTTIPRPVPRPSGLTAPQTQQPVAQATPQPAAPTQVATPAALPPVQTQAAPVTPQGVGAWVQLSSQRSEEAARAGIPDLQSRYGALFNGAALDVSRVDLGERGVYYRVRLPQPTMADANAVCNAIKGQGGDCFVLNN